MRLRPRKGLARREIEGSVYIVDASSSRLHRLNDTGSFIWKELAAGRGAARAAESLAAEFEVSGRDARADVEAFMATLLAEGLLEEDR